MLSHENLQEREPFPDQNYNPFKFNPKELGELLDPKNPELLMKYGGTIKILEGLEVNPTKGLSSSNEGLDINESKSRLFQERQRIFGKNVIPEGTQLSLSSLIWKLCQDQTLITLSISALMTLIFDINEDVGWVEGTATITTIIVVILTHAINDYQKEKVFRKLNKHEEGTANVIRSGKRQQINVNEINVGDILLLEPGNIVPVDGIFLNGHDLTCDESSATGESDPIHKGRVEDGMDPFILSGTKVFNGTGKCVVIAVGKYSKFLLCVG